MRFHNCRGFSLAEMNVATAVGTLILAAAASTYLMSVKGIRAVSNYAEIHKGAREAVNFFAKDMRAVYSINAYSSTNLTVTIPLAFGTTGIVTSNKTVSYFYTSNIANGRTNGWLKRFDSSTGKTSMLATNIYFFQYTLYDHIGSNTTLTNSAKSIAVEIKLNKFVINQIQSEDYISARMDMRNKP